MRAVAPDVAARMDYVAAGLDREGGEVTKEMIDHRMHLAHEWDTLMVQEREILGPESTLAAPAFDDLRAAATGGPVVVLNLSRWRCDALIVRSTEPKPQVVALPELTDVDARARAQQYLSALQDYEADLGRRDALDQVATETLSWLWWAAARPVLTALRPEEQVDEKGTWPRLWWCPTGPLTLLPLHAAAHDDPADPDGSGAVIDRVISSYTPTLRALARARTAQDDKVSREDQRLLRVYLGSTPGEAGLSAVDRSSPYLDQLIPPDRQTVLPGPDETHEAVMAELTRHGWVHFGCHGTLELDNPSTGGLVLYDQTLTVATLSNLRPDQAEFAFLAACKTAVGGAGMPDEAINLTAALQYAGYSHVIGTLWSVSDRAAVRVTNAVYGALHSTGRVDPKGVAKDLHHAVRAERVKFRSHPWAWAPFLHAGP